MSRSLLVVSSQMTSFTNWLQGSFPEILPNDFNTTSTTITTTLLLHTKIIMAEYLTKLLNERHPDRRVMEDVLEEYLSNSDSDNDSDNDTIGSETEAPESVELSSGEEFDMTTDEADAHFLQ